MSILSTSKGRVSNALASKRSLRTALKSEAGAFDLASIMVGLIILGIAVGIIAATVFLVIPWSQDKAAKSQLDSVVQAENTFIGLTVDGTLHLTYTKAYDGSKVDETMNTNSYGIKEQLKAAGVADFTGLDNLELNTTHVGATATEPAHATYTAIITSDSGKKFKVTNNSAIEQVTE